MAAAAMDLEEEDTATVLFSQNACVDFHFSERVVEI
jgi:cytochrome c551/c552